MITKKSAFQLNFAMMLMIILYAVSMFAFLILRFGTQRSVLIQTRREHGISVINNIKYKVPFVTEQTAIPVHADNLIAYLFLSNTEFDECLSSIIIKIAISLLLIAGGFDWFAQDNYRAKLLFKSIFYLLFALVLSEIFKYAATSAWVNDSSHHLRGYQYKNNFYAFFSSRFIPLIAVFSLKNRRSITTIESLSV